MDAVSQLFCLKKIKRRKGIQIALKSLDQLTNDQLICEKIQIEFFLT